MSHDIPLIKSSQNSKEILRVYIGKIDIIVRADSCMHIIRSRTFYYSVRILQCLTMS